MASELSKKSARPPYRLLILVILTAALAAAGIYAFRSGPSGQNQDPKGRGRLSGEPMTVTASTAVQADFPVYLTALGNVVPLQTVTVRSRVDGEIVRIAFKEGQTVKAGDLLAKIDPRPFQAQLMQAEGQLRRDQALLKNADIDLIRYKTLLAQDSIAEQQTIGQEWLVKQYRGTVEIDKGLVADARLQLSYTDITAPISGRIGLRLVDQGNIVHAADAGGLAVITQIQPITVVFTVPEDTLPELMKHFTDDRQMAVEAYDRSGSLKLAQGRLAAIDNQIDAATGTVKLKAQFANADMALFPNQFVTVRLHLETLPGAVVIPTTAIQRGAIGTFVYAVDADQKALVKTIRLGPLEGGRAAVLEGLRAGDRVVVDGADKLRNNSRVNVLSDRGESADGPDKSKAGGGPAPENKRIELP